MRKPILRNLAVASLVISAAAITAGAHAGLTGDTVNGAIVGGPGAFEVVPPSAIVGGGVEFVVEFVGTPAFNLDVGDASVHFFSVFGQPISTGAGETLVLSDMDGVGGNQVIVGIANFQSNQSEFTISDVSFTDHTVTMDLSPIVWNANADVSFDLVIVPAPGAFALLGIAGLAARRRRRA